MTVTDFAAQVYNKLKRVPAGRVTTYGYLAKAIKNPKSARAVGNALNKNPFAPVVPCHRVVKSDGRLGGFASGTKKKISLLRKEGIMVKAGRVEDFSEKLYILEN